MEEQIPPSQLPENPSIGPGQLEEMKLNREKEHQGLTEKMSQMKIEIDNMTGKQSG